LGRFALLNWGQAIVGRCRAARFRVSKNLRTPLFAMLSVGIILLCAIGGVYWACQHQPEFYQAALVQDPAAARMAGDALARHAVDLASDIRSQPRWQAQFTVDQINGWLAYQGERSHDRFFAPSISEPRVAVAGDKFQVAFRWSKLAWSAIVNLQAEVYLQEANVVAVRICRARAGLLPLPLAGLINDLVASGQEFGLDVVSREIDGDPLLLISLPDTYDHGKRQFTLESLELTDGQIYLSGRGQRTSAATEPVMKQPDSEPQASRPQPSSENIQR
jgi:hypothetical protein